MVIFSYFLAFTDRDIYTHREVHTYLTAGALEHLRDGNDTDGLSDGGPDEDLSKGTALHSHVVGGEGGDGVHITYSCVCV